MKSAKDGTDIISVYQQLWSYRAASEHCCTTHRTVKKVVGQVRSRPGRRAAATAS